MFTKEDPPNGADNELGNGALYTINDLSIGGRSVAPI